MRIQEFIRWACQKNTAVDMGVYLPVTRPGVRIPIGVSQGKLDDCGCLVTFMPPMNGFDGGAVTVLCDKHELGQLLAEERVRLEKAWAQRGP